MKLDRRLFNALESQMQAKGYAPMLRRRYHRVVEQFIVFHGKRDPGYMGMREIELFLGFLERQGVGSKERESTFQALLFLYTYVLKKALQKEYLAASRQMNGGNNTGHKPVQQVMTF